MIPREFIYELDYIISQRDYHHVLVFQQALSQVLLSEIESLQDLHTYNRYINYLITQIDATIFILKGITHLQQNVYQKNGVVILITNNYFRNRNEESHEDKINLQLINLLPDESKDISYCSIWVNKYNDAIFFHIGTNLVAVDDNKPSVEEIIYELKALKKSFQIKLQAVQNEIRFQEGGETQDIPDDQASLLSLITLQLFKGAYMGSHEEVFFWSRAKKEEKIFKIFWKKT